jgi:hypothetical protein
MHGPTNVKLRKEIKVLDYLEMLFYLTLPMVTWLKEEVTMGQ